MRSRIWLTLLAVGPATAFAWGDGCEFRAERAGGIEAAGAEKVVIRAGAGDMKVVGRSNAVRVEARGTACGSSQEIVDAIKITVRREGGTIFVETEMPQNDGNWKLLKNQSAYIDIGIALPSNIPVEAVDSSGDTVVEDLAALTIQDSSGDLEITRVAGLVDVGDSSGDISIDGAGSVRLRDSSGDIDVTDTLGDVEVSIDSSGDMRIARAAGNVRVEQDSSGNIRIEDVKGNAIVESDSSGDIYAGRIGGEFAVRGDSSGDIEHDEVVGKVSIPADKIDN